MKRPVVTAIDGAGMGGGAGLAIAGDLAVMSASARIGYPEAKHGIVAAIAMANLVRQVGRKAAFELVALGEPIGAAKALALGVGNRVAPAAQLAAVSRPAMAETKRLFHEVADLPLDRALERGRETNRRMRAFDRK